LWKPERSTRLGGVCPCPKWFFVVAAVIVSLAGVPSSAAQSNPPSEFQLKAAFLFNFAKFTEWPPGAFSSASAPINLCIWGSEPLEGALDEIVRGKTLNNRELHVMRTINLEDLTTCQVVFIAITEGKRMSEISRP
jgi:YfiR/HmsC-like